MYILSESVYYTAKVCKKNVRCTPTHEKLQEIIKNKIYRPFYGIRKTLPSAKVAQREPSGACAKSFPPELQHLTLHNSVPSRLRRQRCRDGPRHRPPRRARMPGRSCTHTPSRGPCTIVRGTAPPRCLWPPARRPSSCSRTSVRRRSVRSFRAICGCCRAIAASRWRDPDRSRRGPGRR